MNYKKIYNALIQKRRDFPIAKDGKIYCETHHIMPKCMNGSNDRSNLVNLTAREHYIAHLLLWKHYKDINVHLASPLLTAITFMQCKSKYINGRVFRFNSRLYEKIRLHVKERNSKKRIINNGICNKLIFKDEPLPIGWVEGRISNFSNTFMITNGKENRRIAKGEKIPDGWRSGNSKADSLTGLICITNGMVNKYIKPTDKIEPGFHIGTHSKCCTGFRMITNGVQVKYLKDNETVPDGWHLGGLKGKKYITNGKDNILINETDLVPDGWCFGMTMKITTPRKNTRRIKNVRLKKNRKLRPGESLTRDMIRDGWEYGIYISDESLQKKQQESIHMTFNGESHSLREWSEITGMKLTTIRKRYYNLYAKGITDPKIIFDMSKCSRNPSRQH